MRYAADNNLMLLFIFIKKCLDNSCEFIAICMKCYHLFYLKSKYKKKFQKICHEQDLNSVLMGFKLEGLKQALEPQRT